MNEASRRQARPAVARLVSMLRADRAVVEALLATIPVAIATALFLPGRDYFAKGQWGMLYLLVIVLVAGLGGVRSAVAAAALSFLAWNYFFLPPYKTLFLQDSKDWVTLIVFLVVALVVGVETAQLHAREERARTSEGETQLLSSVASRLLSLSTEPALRELLFSVIEQAAGPGPVALFLVDGGGALRPSWNGPAPDDAEDVAERAHVVFDDVRVIEAEGSRPGVSDVLAPIHGAARVFGVLFVGGRPSRFQRFVTSLADLAAAFLERRELSDRAMQMEAVKETDKLKSSLVSSVSHELKTPLASIKATVSGLLDEPADSLDARLRQELEAVSEDVGRLEANVSDLLDLSRLETGNWPLSTDLFGIGEVIGGVLSSLPRDKRQRVDYSVPEGLPAVLVDFGQLARALGIMVENALTYSPSGSRVLLGATEAARRLHVFVEDTGPGIPDEEKELVFEKFYRGLSARRHAGGTGLGLTIVKEVVRAHGGEVWVEDVEPHGSRLVVSLSLPRGGGS